MEEGKEKKKEKEYLFWAVASWASFWEELWGTHPLPLLLFALAATHCPQFWFLFLSCCLGGVGNEWWGH